MSFKSSDLKIQIKIKNRRLITVISQIGSPAEKDVLKPESKT